jgi:hypothetical protein
VVSGQTVRRSPLAVDGITLHQTAVEFRPTRYYLDLAGGDRKLALALRALMGPRGARAGVAAHYFAHDDLAVRLLPLDWYVYHGNRLNGSTIGVEVSGLFSGLLDDPDTPPREDLLTTWGDDPPMVLTPKRIRGARMAVRDAVIEGRAMGMPIRYAYAHRQSNGSKPGDPGEGLWRAVILEYAVPELGLAPRHAFTLDNPGRGKDGLPIPRQWDPKGVGDYR